MISRSLVYRFGPVTRNGTTCFRLWAPAAHRVDVECGGARTPLSRQDDGVWQGEVRAAAEDSYRFIVDGAVRVPDPASRGQASDVDGESVLVSPDHAWRIGNWRGRPWEETVLYELHAGLLGGFSGVVRHLPRLAALGITAVELMPVADFPGRRNWGYDGVLPFAPDRSYGTADELKALVDAAHAHEMMVFLDVVYNHFGPQGNWLGTYAPQFFRHDVRTPWGVAVDFREEPVRRFFLENALHWIHEFRIDGLRLDAVHAIADEGWLAEFAREIRASLGGGRHVHLVVENDNNDPRLLRSGFTAQWNDDFHHALHVLLTGETEGYYTDYADWPAKALARILSEGFAYQGGPSVHRGGRARGASTEGLPPTAFVSFLQNHDQVGNRAFGERLTLLAHPDALRAAIALQLLCPQIPLLFMGEESGAREPFLYFTDFDPDLAEKVREGRRAEFSQFAAFRDEKARADIPDPNALTSFEASRPDFEGANSQEWNCLYTSLLALRRERIVPHLRGTVSLGAEAIGRHAVIAHWRLGDGSRLTIAGNFGEIDAGHRLPRAKPIWGTSAHSLPPRSTLAWIEP